MIQKYPIIKSLPYNLRISQDQLKIIEVKHSWKRISIGQTDQEKKNAELQAGLRSDPINTDCASAFFQNLLLGCS